MSLTGEILLFFFSFLLTLCAFSVVTTKNPVHAVFYLILSFCLSSVLLLFFNIEFIALLFVVVYVGAIAVLFLFVVMMLDLRVSSAGVKDEPVYLDTSIIISLIIFGLFLFYYFEAFYTLKGITEVNNPYYIQFISLLNEEPNIFIVGEVLYTFFSPVFILAGYLLLLAMLGSIMLTLKHHIASRKQFSFFQQERKIQQAVLKYKVSI